MVKQWNNNNDEMSNTGEAELNSKTETNNIRQQQLFQQQEQRDKKTINNNDFFSNKSSSSCNVRWSACDLYLQQKQLRFSFFIVFSSLLIPTISHFSDRSYHHYAYSVKNNNNSVKQTEYRSKTWMVKQSCVSNFAIDVASGESVVNRVWSFMTVSQKVGKGWRDLYFVEANDGETWEESCIRWSTTHAPSSWRPSRTQPWQWW